MSNYANQMPKEFQDALKDKLIDTMKVQKYMSGRTPTELQLNYYAKSMHNHMDNFLGSGRWPEEHNIFRSSNEQLMKTTKFQRELLVEKTLQEQKNLKEMFSGNPEGTRLALLTHMKLANERLKAFDAQAATKSIPVKIKHMTNYNSLDSQIADHITSTGEFDRWEF